MTNPISLVVDDEQEILIFRLRGEYRSSNLAEHIIDHLVKNPRGRRYSLVFDCRNLEGPLLDAISLEDIAKHWRNFSDRDDAGRKTAFVRRRGLGAHPLEPRFSEILGLRDVAHFSDFDEALDWIRVRSAPHAPSEDAGLQSA